MLLSTLLLVLKNNYDNNIVDTNVNDMIAITQ